MKLKTNEKCCILANSVLKFAVTKDGFLASFETVRSEVITTLPGQLLITFDRVRVVQLEEPICGQQLLR